MISKSASIAFFVALCASIARADVTPTVPGPGTVYNEGGTCHVAWNGDTSSPTAWKSMSIQLMTGNNFDMVPLTTVASNQDGTVSGSFDFTCPQVTPNSAIYFFQFTSPGSPDTEWTTRFAIASSSGQTTPPSESTQPGTNQAIPWGTGKLANSAAAVPPPSGNSVAKTMTSIPPTAPTSSLAATSTKAAAGAATTSSSKSNATPSAASIAPNVASNSASAGSTATGSGAAGSVAATGTSPSGSTPTDTSDSNPTDTSDSNPTDTSDSNPTDTSDSSPTDTDTDSSPSSTGASSSSSTSASKANNGASSVGHSIAVVMLAASALVCIVSF